MKEKIQRFSSIFVSVVSKLIIFGIIVFILYSIGKSVWKNYLVVQKIDSIEKEISDEQVANNNYKNLIIYYQTDTFKELEARRKLGYKKPGENVLIIPDLNPAQTNNDPLPLEDNTKKEDIETPNFIKWYHYIIK